MIFKFRRINAYRVTVPDTGFFQHLIQLHIPPDTLKTAYGLIITEVSHGNETFNAHSRNDKSAVLIAGYFKVGLNFRFLKHFFFNLFRLRFIFLNICPKSLQERLQAVSADGTNGKDFHMPFVHIRLQAA